MRRRDFLRRAALALAGLAVPAGAVSAAAARPDAAGPRVAAPNEAAPAEGEAELAATTMWRAGYCSTIRPIDRYPQIGSLRAGWYVNFQADPDPALVNNMLHVQTVRIHQLTKGWPQRYGDRDAYPYVRGVAISPTLASLEGEGAAPAGMTSSGSHRLYLPLAARSDYQWIITSPSGTRITWHSSTAATVDRTNSIKTLQSIAKARPGSIWLVGNEMDRRDWDGGGQDEMLPEVYARAYREIHTAIKDPTKGDPTAKVAIGGIIQATPARLEYLNRVWSAYQQYYGRNLGDDVDVWNVHNFILIEQEVGYGAKPPPGYGTGWPPLMGEGDGYTVTNHNSMPLFRSQLRAFRQWMKDRGQQHKELLLTEFGILYRYWGGGEHFTGTRVRDFLRNTFTYLNNEDPKNPSADSSLSGVDGGRLVQRWAWFSLDGGGPDYTDLNVHGNLFDPNTLQMTETGRLFADWAGARAG